MVHVITSMRALTHLEIMEGKLDSVLDISIKISSQIEYFEISAFLYVVCWDVLEWQTYLP